MYLFTIKENNNNGDYMTKKVMTISALVMSILLVSILLISSTYAVIINVIKNEEEEIISKLTIRDVLVDNEGNYNNLYYDIKRELGISYEEGETLIESVPLNNALETIAKDVVNYKLHHHKRMSNNDLYNLIVTNINLDTRIDVSVKERVINKTQIYINDIADYIYNFDINLIK